MFLMISANSAPPTRSFTYVTGETIEPAEVTTNEDNMYSYLQTGVDTYANNSIPNSAFQDASITAARLVGTDITKVGTIVTGIWNADVIEVLYGGTGTSSFKVGGVMLGTNTASLTTMDILADSELIVGDGSGAPVAESGATLRTSLGLGTGDTASFSIVRTGDGALGAPAVAPASETDTGLFWTGSTIQFAIDGGVEWSMAAGASTLGGNFIPDVAGIGVLDIGDATNFWDVINHKVLTDRSGVFLTDKNKSYNMFKNMEAEVGVGFCRRLENRGKSRVKFSKLKAVDDDLIDLAIEEASDDIIFDENTIIDNQITYDEFQIGDFVARKGEMTRWRDKGIGLDGKRHIIQTAEGLELTAYMSHISGALRKAIDKIEELETKVAVLEGS